ncbi:M23 family metallopeptidase [Streptomyces sp. NRRL S-340]|uniref:M23 family metallopeptidase n=1 Tax=Streptomyces sp. NRRL S-340 TaxID=1463901 RepID=UPI00055E9FE7|nr:M23 family metallopeptidase [Streptomyces sp. NRRL S-340]
MNDRHPSGTATPPAPASDDAPAPYAPYGGQEAAYGDFTTYGDYDATGFHTGTHTTAAFQADPLFGDLHTGDAHAADAGTTGAYDTTQWSTGSHHTLTHDAYAAQHHAAYDTGAYDTTAWSTGYQHLSAVPQQPTPVDATGQWDTNAWLQDPAAAAPAEQTQQWDWGTQTFDTGAYDATQWNSAGAADEGLPLPEEPSAGPDPAATGELPALPEPEDRQEATAVPAPRAASRGGSRSRRRPAKRSALLTVAVPSVCVVGVAGIAAASVGSFTGDDQETSASASEAHPVQASTANNKLDTQLQSLSAGANDFADRASRTQERIDLKAQQEAERKKAAQEAARKERLRPKFALPVAQRGLSAYFGQAGVNWMSVHTGIDFPVWYGTTVMAATDGTVRTQFNSAYGNMLILTAKDGTETWYCHLSRYQVVTGATVKAGQPIAYSGKSGNSTGPHLHFEVRPAGGAPIDPLPWLRSHGLNPT